LICHSGIKQKVYGNNKFAEVSKNLTGYRSENNFVELWK